MAWLALMGLLLIAWLAVTLPLVSARRQRAVGHSEGVDLAVGVGRWAIVSCWTLCIVALIVYVPVAKVIGCWREDSVLGDETWSLLPLGQVCTFRATDRRPADVTRPGWTLTICAVITLVGIALAWRERLRRHSA